jgi:hypothetical protein
VLSGVPDLRDGAISPPDWWTVFVSGLDGFSQTQ